METQEKEAHQVGEDLWEKEVMMVCQEDQAQLVTQAEMEFQVIREAKEAKEMMLLCLHLP